MVLPEKDANSLEYLVRKTTEIREASDRGKQESRSRAQISEMRAHAERLDKAKDMLIDKGISRDEAEECVLDIIEIFGLG
jgi:hypothetical protein